MSNSYELWRKKYKNETNTGSVSQKKKQTKKRIENNRSFCRDEKRHKPLVLSPEYPEKKLKKPDILSWNFITLDIKKKKKNSQKCPEEKKWVHYWWEEHQILITYDWW